MGSLSRVDSLLLRLMGGRSLMAPWAFLSMPCLFSASYSIIKGLEVWGLLSKLKYSSFTLEYTPNSRSALSSQQGPSETPHSLNG